MALLDFLLAETAVRNFIARGLPILLRLGWVRNDVGFSGMVAAPLSKRRILSPFPSTNTVVGKKGSI